MKTAISIENLSKIYRLGEIGTGTISRDLERWYKMKIRGQEDPFLKIGETNERSKKGESDVVYSLSDINFEVQQGEALGIIGKNGAGKSTLLKIISRVTSPTTGKIKIKGRVASLLEVGTGFHPELTGRENIYLNGAILGMRKKEITNKLDEIIDFSGVERYIDTPIKRYSSGMYVRLAFAVAAHLESEILIVDEVLAVGDAEFQKKCLGKMGDISKSEGRTVLFVSHNMAAVQGLCPKAIMLQDGNIKTSGPSYDVVVSYMNYSDNKSKAGLLKSGPAGLKIYTESISGERRDIFKIGEPIKFIIHLSTDILIQSAALGLGILDNLGQRVLTHHTMFQHPSPWSVKKSVIITVDWPECILCPGSYRFVLALYDDQQMIALWDDVGILRVVETDYFGTGRLPDPLVQGKIVTKAKWIIREQ